MSSYNPFSLEGKTILVTGASSGIGRATAVECSKMGANLVITGRNETRLQETFDALEGEGNLMIQADLSTEEGIIDFVGKLPLLNGIVLCAGIVELWPVSFVRRKHIEKIYATNLFAPIEIIRLVVKKKLNKENLSIVGIDSIVGSSDFSPGNSIYGSGKAALSAYFKFAALELASKKIRVNTISPGFILTPMQEKSNVSTEQLEKIISQTPMKRWGQPEDIAFASIFLLSDASSYITGSDIKVDGGYTIPYKS